MSTFPRSPFLLKGALVELSDRFIGMVPNVIVFQYNPETMTRKLEVQSVDDTKAVSEATNAQPYDPPETFDLVLELDAADALENPILQPVAVISGISDRIAAIEMLLYPQGNSSGMGLLGSAAASLGGAGGALAGGIVGGGLGAAAIGSAAAFGAGFIGTNSSVISPVPRGKVPDVLFCWGPGRVVPVRLTSFSVEEQAFSPTLYPIRAKVTIGLKVVAPRNIPCHKSEASKVSIAAYNLYIKQKRGFAAANVANDIESIIGMLPF